MRAVPGLFIVILLLLPRATAAQTGGREARFFFDVNVFASAGSIASERTYTLPFVVFSEVGSLRATYPSPSRSAGFPIDVSGGFMLRPSVGLGVGYTRTPFDNTAALLATIPHPDFLNTPGSGNGTTGALRRTESATTIFIALVPLRTDRAELRFVLGPTFFSYSADLVNGISYTQTAGPSTPQNVVTITDYTTALGTGRGIGGTVAIDFAYFFTKAFAITAGWRQGAAIVTMKPEPLTGIDQRLRVGGTRVFAGVRIRFGG